MDSSGVCRNWIFRKAASALDGDVSSGREAARSVVLSLADSLRGFFVALPSRSDTLPNVLAEPLLDARSYVSLTGGTVFGGVTFSEYGEMTDPETVSTCFRVAGAGVAMNDGSLDAPSHIAAMALTPPGRDADLRRAAFGVENARFSDREGVMKLRMVDALDRCAISAACEAKLSLRLWSSPGADTEVFAKLINPI